MPSHPYHFNATVRPQGALGRTSGTGAITPTMPQHEAGHTIVMFVASAGQAISLSSAQGFAEVTGSPVNEPAGGLTTAVRLATFWVRADAVTMAANGGQMPSPTIADSGDHQIAAVFAFPGCKTTGNPWNVVATGTKAAATNVVAIPGGVTTVDNCLVVAAVAFATDGDTLDGNLSAWDNDSLSGFHEIEDYRTSQGNGSGIGVAIGVKETAGAYSTTDAALTSGSSACAYMSIALEPEASVVSDVSPPTIENFVPSPDTEIGRSDPLQFDILDDSGSFTRIMVVAQFASVAQPEIVHDGEDFTDNYSNGSNTRTAIANGYRYVILRNGGWLSQVSVTPLAIDAGGNENE